MPFTDPPILSDGDRFTQNEANTYLHDNLEALKNPPSAVYITNGLSSNYSTTSTSFVDVDSTNMALSITTTGDGTGGDASVIASLCGTLDATGRVYFRILEDGIVLNPDDGVVESDATATGIRPVSFFFLLRETAAGEHTYTLQWKTSSGTASLAANAGTSGFDCKAVFWVRELT